VTTTDPSDGPDRRSPALEITGLTKSYPFGFLHQKRRRVLGPLDLRLERGEIFGYLGPNGAGKTTTIKVLMGFIRRDEGTLRVLGHEWSDPAWRAKTGYLPEHPYFYDYLTAEEYMDYSGRLIGLAAHERSAMARELIGRVGLSKARSRPLRRFSKGMLQRLGVAQALLGNPELLVLDEPTSGLDPLGRHLVRNLILEQRDKGRTVLFCTHILSDAESLCDRVALIRDGQVVGAGRLDEILRVDVDHMEVLVSGVEEPALVRLGLERRSRSGERWRLQVAEGSLVPVLGALVGEGARVLSVQPSRQSLEELFVREVGGAEGPDAVDAA
jgi:ABC-2 type transport system ATP-binding protein